MKMYRLQPYFLLAASTFNALIALTILCAQQQEPLVSVTNNELMPNKREYEKNTKDKPTLMNRSAASAETLKKAAVADVDFTTIKGASDFDFFIGDWRVHHRRLKERLALNNDWEEFEGTSVARKILGGLGNMDENVIELPSGTYRAATIRTFDAARQLWTIWWIDSRNPGHLDPPVVGRFENGVGTFYADDQFKGKPIRVRYLWNQSASPHWEQAFSEDGGKTWETNWTMDFTRTH